MGLRGVRGRPIAGADVGYLFSLLLVLSPSSSLSQDELDAIGTKRFDSDKSGDREVQRTMLELLNQLDGFSSDDRIKVSGARRREPYLLADAPISNPARIAELGRFNAVLRWCID